MAYVEAMVDLAWHQESVGVDLDDAYMWFYVVTNLHCLRLLKAFEEERSGAEPQTIVSWPKPHGGA